MNDIPKHGAWYKIIDFIESDWGSSWGYILYLDGEEIERTGGFSRVHKAQDAARIAVRTINQKRKESK